MKKATLTDLQARFADYLALSRKEPVMVMRNGKPVAILIGVHDEQEAERLVFASSRRLQKILEAGRKEIREGHGIPNEEFWQQLEAELPVRSKKAVSKKKAKPV